MDRLSDLKVFVEVCRTGTLTAAAKGLGVSKAKITRQISAIEHALGTKLLNRNTRHASVTSAGAMLLERAPELLVAFDNLEAQVRNDASALRGSIRLGVQPAFGTTCVLPAVRAFQSRHPGLHISLHLESDTADIIRDGLDISLRVVPFLRNTNYISQMMVRSIPQRLVASPDYLKKCGRPTDIDDLSGHNCLIHTLKAPVGTWIFKSKGGTRTVKVNGDLSSDFGDALRAAAILGHGISMHPSFMIEEDIAASRLEVVLPDCKVQDYSIFALYPNRTTTLRVRALLAFLNEWFRTGGSRKPPPLRSVKRRGG